MRLLIVNANTTAHISELMAEAALALPLPELLVRAVTPERGPAVIATRFENDIAAGEVIALAVEHAAEADAVLLGVSYDTGLRALRELLPVPVVGMTQSALLAARAVGDRIGLVGLGARTEPLYRDTVAAAGFAGAIAAETFVELPAAFSPGDRTAVFDHMAEVVARLAERERLDVVVLLGAVMAGATAALSERTPVPVLDGLTTGVHLAGMLAGLSLPKAATGAFAPVGGRALVGVDEPLASVAAGRTPLRPG